jgi:hypothetical protein
MKASLLLRIWSRLVPFFVLALCAIALAFACSGKVNQAGGLEVIIDTDLQVGAGRDFDFLDVKIEQETSPAAWLRRGGTATPVDASSFPTTVAIAAGSSSDQTVRITLTAYSGGAGGSLVVQSQAETPVPSDRVLELHLHLYRVCVHVSCTENQSCWPGRGCQTIQVQPADLAPYAPGDQSNLGGPSDGGTSQDDSGTTPTCPPCTNGRCTAMLEGNVCTCVSAGSPCPGGAACTFTGTCPGGTGSDGGDLGRNCGPANCGTCCDPSGGCVGYGACPSGGYCSTGGGAPCVATVGCNAAACGGCCDATGGCVGAGARCTNGGTCTGLAGICAVGGSDAGPCGAPGGVCCPGGGCNAGPSPTYCNPSNVCASCGVAGGPCCPYNGCFDVTNGTQGCCVNSTCVAEGAVCPAAVGGGICGSVRGPPGCVQPDGGSCGDLTCCPGSVCLSRDQICNGSNQCQLCGNSGSSACPDGTCNGGSVNIGGTCVTCGGLYQSCCHGTGNACSGSYYCGDAGTCL